MRKGAGSPDGWLECSRLAAPFQAKGLGFPGAGEAARRRERVELRSLASAR